MISTSLAIAALIFTIVLTAEYRWWGGKLARLLISTAVAVQHQPSRLRLQEEWLRHLQDLQREEQHPGVMWAFGTLLASPRIRRSVKTDGLVESRALVAGERLAWAPRSGAGMLPDDTAKLVWPALRNLLENRLVKVNETVIVDLPNGEAVRCFLFSLTEWYQQEAEEYRKRRKARFGLSRKEWAAAKTDMRQLIGRAASQGRLISLHDLMAAFAAFKAGTHLPYVGEFIGRILNELFHDDFKAGRPVLVAIVSYNQDDARFPMMSFSDDAREHGITDPDSFWARQVKEVLVAYAQEHSPALGQGLRSGPRGAGH